MFINKYIIKQNYNRERCQNINIRIKFIYFNISTDDDVFEIYYSNTASDE